MSAQSVFRAPIQDAAAVEPSGQDRPGRGVLEGAFVLLEALSSTGGAGLTALARSSGLPKTTAHRLLEQLVDLGAVVRDDVVGYRIGGGLRRLADPERPFSQLRNAARPVCAELAARAGATAGIAVMRDRQMISLSVESAPRGIDPGSVASFPVDTAAGQVLLAHDPALGPPPSRSEREWRRVRAAIRDRGVALDQQELTAGISCVAAPVRAKDGTVVAALAVIQIAASVPAGLPELVRRAADRTSQRLG